MRAQPKNSGSGSAPNFGLSWAGLIKFYLFSARLAEPEIFRAGLGWAHEIPKFRLSPKSSGPGWVGVTILHVRTGARLGCVGLTFG